MEIWHYLYKEKVGNIKNKFLHTTFFNNDFSFNIVCRSIQLFAVILRTTMKGSVSHFIYKGLSCFSMLFRINVSIIF